jgi:simple sugar transport system ATP-binding protein
MGPVIQMKGISKHFPRVTANDRVDLSVGRGEIHALVGENGAGKTTLMNILYGLIRPDGGQVLVDGRRLPVERGFLGIDYGIGMIHQHFMLIDRFTALENIILGAEPGRGPLLDRNGARERVARLMAEFGLPVDLDTRVAELSVGEEQKVEILRVLYRQARIIVMDEPTAVLTPQETESLFSTLRAFAADGRTVVFITHKLEEVMEVADTVTVMRGGRVVGSVAVGDTDAASLAQMMVGRSLEEVARSGARPGPDRVLDVSDLSLVTRKGRVLLDDVSLQVRSGEILGICGVDGNGQVELHEVLMGLRRPSSGRVAFRGKDITLLSTARRLRAGLAHIPADRNRSGIVGELSLDENLVLGRHRGPAFSGGLLLKRTAIAQEAQKLIAQFGIGPATAGTPVRWLSGGNQQKAVLARELAREPRLLIASQPTRGLDIGASGLVHSHLLAVARAGGAVLLISADLAEIMKLCNRIGVMYRGAISGILDRSEATEEKLGLMMMGVAA